MLLAPSAIEEVMRGMAGGLGLRCNHCHVGGSETSLEGMRGLVANLREELDRPELKSPR